MARRQHFHGLEVFPDGTAILHNSCRRHEGVTLTAATLQSVHVDARYKLVEMPADLPVEENDIVGGKNCGVCAEDYHASIRHALLTQWPSADPDSDSDSSGFWNEALVPGESLALTQSDRQRQRQRQRQREREREGESACESRQSRRRLVDVPVGQAELWQGDCEEVGAEGHGSLARLLDSVR